MEGREDLEEDADSDALFSQTNAAADAGDDGAKGVALGAEVQESDAGDDVDDTAAVGLHADVGAQGRDEDADARDIAEHQRAVQLSQGAAVKESKGASGGNKQPKHKSSSHSSSKSGSGKDGSGKSGSNKSGSGKGVSGKSGSGKSGSGKNSGNKSHGGESTSKGGAHGRKGSTEHGSKSGHGSSKSGGGKDKSGNGHHHGSKASKGSGSHHSAGAQYSSKALAPAPLDATQLNAVVPPLTAWPARGAVEERAMAKRAKLLQQVRSAKTGSSEGKRLMNKWNVFMPALNAAAYPPPASHAIPILLLVFQRTLYLEPALRLYSRVHGINTTTLVVSHQGTDPDVWRLVESVRFCRVRQLLFPHAAGFRGPAALKLHFTWALGQAFAQMEAPEVLYMEDDYWPSPDLYASTLWLRGVREEHCPECLGSVLGDHPRDWTERYAEAARWLAGDRRALLYRPFVGCSFNSPAGLALPAGAWERITANADGYCDRGVVAYDDALHALQNARGAERQRALEPGWLTHAYPRCIHVGRCGGVSFRADATLPAAEAASICNVTADLELFARTWVLPMLAGGVLAADTAPAASKRAVPQHARSALRLDEGVALCRERYVVDDASGRLAGVAPSNHTMPRKFSELCQALLKPTARV